MDKNSGSSDFLFAELEQDSNAIAAFVGAQNARTLGDLQDDEYRRDVAEARRIMEADDEIGGVVRRGDLLFTYKQTKDAPRGRWLCLPDDQEPTADADWQIVFDLDAYCAAEGQEWHWRGARTAWFDPKKVLFALSLGGSDQVRHVEFDIGTKAFVDGGFDLPACRSNAIWRDVDTVLWSTSAGEGGATSSSWPRVVRELRREDRPEEGRVIYEIGHDDLTTAAFVMPDGTGDAEVGFSRYLAIGQEQVVLRRGGEDVILDAPDDTGILNNRSHFAFVVQEKGGTPGQLILDRIEGGARRVLFDPEPDKSVDPGSMILLRDWMLWTERAGMKPRLMALSLTNDQAMPIEVSLPESCQTFGIGGFDAVQEPGRETLQIGLRGFLTPPSVYLFDLADGVAGIEYKLMTRMKSRFDSTDMQVELHHAISQDGTRVPYHLVLPKGADANMGNIPVLQYGYGGFGISLWPGYQPVSGKLWLEKGGAYVLAHIRGGGEMGPDWHLQAKGAGRYRAFEDFAAVADDLVRRGITRPDRIACHGGSNGGILCGVMLTRYPEKYGAIWASVGVFDMMRFHVFPAGRAWIDEYGDPDRNPDRDWLLEYSPLHRVEGVDNIQYPPFLIDSHDNDDRVDPSHARRMAARLFEAGHSGYFVQHSDGGHGGGGASEAAAREVALGYAFLRRALSVET